MEKEGRGLLTAAIELPFLSMLESGVREPSQAVARAIAKTLRCTVGRLLWSKA